MRFLALVRACGSVGLAMLAFVALCHGTVAHAADSPPMRVALVGNQNDPRVAAVRESITKALGTDCHVDCVDAYQVTPIGLDARQIAAVDAAADLVVAVGSDAGEIVARTPGSTPRLYGFLPLTVWQELADCCAPDKHRDSALYIDQPSLRQFELIRQVVPDARRVGVMLGDVPRARRAELDRIADDLGYVLQVADVADSGAVGPSLRHLVDDIDVLLALPDPAVFNRNTVYSILLTTYSAGIPVVGYSRAMVKAGAAAAVFASPPDVGAAITQRIRSFRRDGRLSPPDYGTVFSVAINADVAKSLRLPSLIEDTLLHRLEGAAR